MLGEVGANKRSFDHLPIEEVLHELDDPNCTHCQSQLKEFKTVEKITEIVLNPAPLVKRRHMEKVYMCKHCEETGEHSPIIEIAHTTDGYFRELCFCVFDVLYHGKEILGEDTNLPD